MPEIVKDWSEWEAWEEMYQKWVKLYGEEEIDLRLDSLRNIYQWFMRESVKTGVKINKLNIELLLDPSFTYNDVKTILLSVMEHPLTEEEEKEISSVELQSKLEELKKRAKRLKELDEELKKSEGT